jgi:tRNA pseudouridine38-40 synthase
MIKRSYRLDIMYDGTNYSGWQVQPNATSIQQIIQNAVRILVKEEVYVIGAGRTDAGVHAYGQVAHFHCQKELDLHLLHKSLNGIIPKDIRIKEVRLVPSSFHAQRSSVAKEYHFRLHTGAFVSPFVRQYVWHIPYKLDRELLVKACSFFVGTHDFSSFTNSASEGACAKNAVRTITELEAVCEKDEILLTFKANGFLYKMVRNITGQLVNVATKKSPLEAIPLIFAAKDRRLAAMGAPAKGLFLMHVEYPQEFH